jgi:type I restriction enzyme R subunit
LFDVKRRSEQTIDTVSQDTVLFTGFDEQAKEKALLMTQTFKKFIEENKDQITALQIIYHQPYAKRHLTREQLKDLAEAIGKPPFQLAPEMLWHAYEQLDKARVRGAGTQKLLTNIISLVRFAAGLSDVLEPYSDFVEMKFEAWMKQQESAGRAFTPAQMEWLKMIKDHIATSLAIEMDDFELAPFHDKGGAAKVYQLFGNDLTGILEELNEVLAA